VSLHSRTAAAAEALLEKASAGPRSRPTKTKCPATRGAAGHCPCSA